MLKRLICLNFIIGILAISGCADLRGFQVKEMSTFTPTKETIYDRVGFYCTGCTSLNKEEKLEMVIGELVKDKLDFTVVRKKHIDEDVTVIYNETVIFPQAPKKDMRSLITKSVKTEVKKKVEPKKKELPKKPTIEEIDVYRSGVLVETRKDPICI